MCSTALIERDISILLMVHQYGGVTCEHIGKRFWPNARSHTPCSEKVSALIKAGYLESRRLPALSGIGSGKAFLTPGPKARPVLAKVLSLSRTELGRIRLETPQFIAHHLAICDFRLSLEMAVETSRIFNLADWASDGELQIKVKDPKTQKDLLLIPDASFTLALPDGTEQTFLVEIDLGTLAPKRLRAKLRGYLARPEDLSPVLWVTVDENRLDNIKRYALEEAQDLGVDPTVFWITTKDKIQENTILSSPIWQIVGGPTIALNSLVPIPEVGQAASSLLGQITFAGGYLS